MKTLLIDGDQPAHAYAYHATEAQAGERAVRHVRGLVSELAGDRAVVCLSSDDRHYFRHDLFPAYKSAKGPPDPIVTAAKAALREAFPSRTVPGLEADDVVGILATHDRMGGEKVMVSSDRDLLTVPGLHFDPRAKERRVIEVPKRDADYAHMSQTLTGCTGDGYPGCPGVGPAKVGKIVWGEPCQWWPQVVLAFKARGLGEADALLQARLARILRATDYDFDSGRVRLWDPTVAELAVSPEHAEAYAAGSRRRDLARRFGVSDAAVAKVVKRETWNHVP